MEGFGQRIKALRNRKNVEQARLAEMMNITQPTLSALESATFPKLERIVQICELLNEPVWQFFLDDPAEISQHPINTLDAKDIEVLQALNRIEPDLRDAVWRAWRQLIEGLVAHCEKDRAR